ncbi:hypothetical protein [Wielerella bovis]|uniref:hypothetical protein n=1 Tax=Wielerella bovis TaxID=2917790 RepID=UPI0020188BAB|nr:hypothetical protein [Wielerella bovis]ULJ65943.1 hypothetical protein MIS31_06575 [Wielerella bovis]
MIHTTPKAVTLFSSKDTGAPKLTASAGSLKTLLKACLVSGYGDKQPLGWEMPFEQGHVAVFRSKSSESNRHFLRIDNAAAKFAIYEGYLNMTAASTGTGKFAYGNNLDRFGYCEYDRSEQPNWWLVGHDKAFIFLSAKRTLNDTCILFFGDIPSIVPQDTGNTLLFSNASTSEALSSRVIDFIGGDGYLLAKTWTGAEQTARGTFNSLAHHSGAGAAYPDKISGGLTAAEMWVYEKGNGGNDYNLRCLLPALFKCQNNLKDLQDGTPIKLDATDDVFLKFCLYNDSHYYLINASHWEA